MQTKDSDFEILIAWSSPGSPSASKYSKRISSLICLAIYCGTCLLIFNYINFGVLCLFDSTGPYLTVTRPKVLKLCVHAVGN